MKQKGGLAFHCHHDTLIEYVYDYDERVEFIKEYKPKSEQKLRLKLFQLIPNDKIPGKNSSAWQAYDKARQAYHKAGKAYYKAWQAYDKARQAYHKAWQAYDKARQAYHKAGKAYDKAGKAYGSKFTPEIEELHKELCPNCPWNGQTIFSKRAK